MMAPDMKVSHSGKLCPLRRIAAAALLLAASPALADETFYDDQGRVSGRSHIDSAGAETFFDAEGRVSGRATTDSAGTTHFFDSEGRNAGSVTPRHR
jgi:hypothetical protein